MASRILIGVALAWICVAPTSGWAAEYFISPDGSDEAKGTLAAPFASVARAQVEARPGDTVWLRGGTYAMQESQIARRDKLWVYVIDLTKSGEAEKPITYSAYKDERPIFDFSAVRAEGFRVIGFNVSGSWLRLKGFEVCGIGVTIKTHTVSVSVENKGSHNIYERLVARDGQGIGFQVSSGSDVLILNCDAFRNHDVTSENGLGGNSDGFGAHPRKGSTGIVMRGCRAWHNSDDGFDCISAAEVVRFENCWAMYNGLSPDGKRLADGNGFKAGGYGSTPVEKLPKPIPRHVVQNCLAVGNKAAGFYANHHVGGQDWIGNTGYGNGVNFRMLERLDDNRTDVPGTRAVLRNNLSYGGRADISDVDLSQCVNVNNSFGMKLSDNDFLSLDETELLAARGEDGGLPRIRFMQPSPQSGLAGKNMGYTPEE